MSANTYPPGLYLVPTPIGNLGDITQRSLDVLRRADLVICEDSRIGGKLLAAFGIENKLAVYNDHSGEGERARFLSLLADGKTLALTSDAGTPLLADPGYKLVRAALQDDHDVWPLPGANALLPALQKSGLGAEHFAFIGFLPPKSAKRQAALAPWKDVQAALVFYETAPRLADSLADMGEIFGGARPAAVVRELTKRFEEGRRGTIAELASYYKGHSVKGEIVVVIGAKQDAPQEDNGALPPEIDNLLRELVKHMPVKKAVGLIQPLGPWKRQVLYDRGLALRDGAAAEDDEA